MWGQGFGPAAELSLGVLDAKQSDLQNCVFGEQASYGSRANGPNSTGGLR